MSDVSAENVQSDNQASSLECNDDPLVAALPVTSLSVQEPELLPEKDHFVQFAKGLLSVQSRIRIDDPRISFNLVYRL